MLNLVDLCLLAILQNTIYKFYASFQICEKIGFLGVGCTQLDCNDIRWIKMQTYFFLRPSTKNMQKKTEPALLSGIKFENVFANLWKSNKLNFEEKAAVILLNWFILQNISYFAPPIWDNHGKWILICSIIILCTLWLLFSM